MEYKTISKPTFFSTCSFTTILKNVLISYTISIILFLIFAFIITYTNVEYYIISPISIAVTLLSILLASFLSGRKSSEKGWLTGCITGFLYMLILFIIGSIVYKSPALSSNGIIMIISGIFSGAIGSIIGINNKKKRR